MKDKTERLRSCPCHSRSLFVQVQWAQPTCNINHDEARHRPPDAAPAAVLNSSLRLTLLRNAQQTRMAMAILVSLQSARGSKQHKRPPAQPMGK